MDSSKREKETSCLPGFYTDYFFLFSCAVVPFSALSLPTRTRLKIFSHVSSASLICCCRSQHKQAEMGKKCFHRIMTNISAMCM